VCDVPHPVVGFSQEVKDGAVVPDVHRGHRPWICNVSLDPSHAVSVFAQPSPCSRQRGRGHVQHRHAAKATSNKVIHEAGIPAPNVDHSGCGCQPRSLQQSKGDRWLRLKPAHLLGGFRGVDTLPVCFAIHGARDSQVSTSVAVLAGVRAVRVGMAGKPEAGTSCAQATGGFPFVLAAQPVSKPVFVSDNGPSTQVVKPSPFVVGLEAVAGGQAVLAHHEHRRGRDEDVRNEAGQALDVPDQTAGALGGADRRPAPPR
jgi:hypothetical protein